MLNVEYADMADEEMEVGSLKSATIALGRSLLHFDKHYHDAYISHPPQCM